MINKLGSVEGDSVVEREVAPAAALGVSVGDMEVATDAKAART